MALTERQNDALDHSRSLCVTAGAGTGKTHVLVSKYIDLLETTDVAVREILALTFTDKAAQEMKERVRNALAEKEGERWEEIREEFIWANISTFHSFCSRVLREFPIEAGIDPAFSVLDEREATKLLDDTINDLLHGNTKHNDREALLSALRAVGSYNLPLYLKALYNRREASEKFFSLLEKDEEAVVRFWQETVARKKSETISELFSDKTFSGALFTLRELASVYAGNADAGTKYLDKAGPILAGITPDQDTGKICENLIAFAALGGRKNMGGKKVFGDDLTDLRAAYATLIDAVKPLTWVLSLEVERESAFTRATLALLHDLAGLFAVFTGVIDAEKERISAIDFSDMIYLTSRLFRTHPRLTAEHFTERYRYVMIDEFQDTDPVQVAIIRAIIGDSNSPTEKVFVVGDPKQSIYLFRDADVTQFKTTQEKIETALGGTTIDLDVNFRSTPEVIGFVNFIFSRLLQDNGKAWEFAYEPIRPSRDEQGSIELLLSPDAGGSAERKRTEAEMIARKIQNIVETGAKQVFPGGKGASPEPPRNAGYGDIAILLTRRSNLTYLEWALGRYGIPYQVHAGTGYYARQEILDLYSILRFLLNEDDDVALYGALRSPYFGISDATLFIASEGQGRSLWERIRSAPDERIRNAASLLETWLWYAPRESPVALINRVIRDSGIYTIYSALPGGEQYIANLEKFLAITRGNEKKGFFTLYRLVSEFTASVEGDQREGEAYTDPGSGDAVNVMTIHASKGLEFPVVVIPDLAADTPSDKDPILIDETCGIGVKVPNPDNGYEQEESAIFAIIKDDNRRKLEAERRRLFYVAATRAKDHLVLCGTKPKECQSDLGACKRPIEWITCCLGLSEEAIENGFVEITPPGTADAIRIRLTDAPESIGAEIHLPAPEMITMPEDAVQAEEEICREITVPDEVMPFTVSALELFREDPERFDRIYVQKKRHAVSACRSGAMSATTWGLIVHEVFEGKEPRAVLAGYGISDPEMEERLTEQERVFQDSALMRSATGSHCEVPFMAEIEGVPFSGIIDRLVKTEDGGWFLIDYKSGGKKANEYDLQMTVYAAAAEKIIGQPVTPLLYFTEPGIFAEITADREEVLAGMKETVREIRSETGINHA